MSRTPACPRCDGPMASALLGEVEVDFCGTVIDRRGGIAGGGGQCGVWLDAGELAAIAEAPAVVEMAAPAAARPGPGGLFCPRCDRPLAPARVRGIEVALDACPQGHGIWFDTGEMDQVLSALRRGKEGS